MRKMTKLSALPLSLLSALLLSGCAETMYGPRQTPAHKPMAMAMVGAEKAGAWYQIYFTDNDSQLNERARMMVGSIAHAATASAGMWVTVIGKTDRSGTQAANMTLSQSRANRVRDALIAAGVPAARIETSWTGENRQEVATANDVSEARNRVVDVTVMHHSH